MDDGLIKALPHSVSAVQHQCVLDKNRGVARGEEVILPF